MDSGLFLGALLSVPTGILVGLATPAIQRRLESFGQDNALRRRVRAAKAEYELAQIATFRRRPSEFTQYLVYVGIKISFIGAAIGIFAGLSYLTGQFLSVYQADVMVRAAELGRATDITNQRMWQFISMIPTALGQLVTIVGTVMILRTAGSALTAWTRVKNFERYKKSIEPILEPQKD
jgi:hypothetical protein